MRLGSRHLWRKLLERLQALYPTDGTTPDQRKGMKLLWWDGVFTSASMGFYLDFEVLYLLALGAGSAVIGARASINSAVSLLAPLLAAWLVERTGKRKLWGSCVVPFAAATKRSLPDHSM